MNPPSENLRQAREGMIPQIQAGINFCQSKDKPVSCEAIGCNGCCRGSVPVTPEESERIIALMDDAAWQRVTQSKKELLENSRHVVCPLLDPESGACTVYDERPISCRAYHVITPKEWCFFDKVGEKAIAQPGWCLEVNMWGLFTAIGTTEKEAVATEIDPDEAFPVLGNLLVAHLEGQAE